MKGVVSVSRNGAYYFILTEWCPAETYSTSLPYFAALENAASAGEPQRDPFDQIFGQVH